MTRTVSKAAILLRPSIFAPLRNYSINDYICSYDESDCHYQNEYGSCDKNHCLLPLTFSTLLGQHIEFAIGITLSREILDVMT